MSLDTANCECNFEDDFKEIIYEINHYHPSFKKKDEALIKKAFCMAKKAHEHQKRFSGEPYFSHPIAATKILLQIQPDIETICACLLHDVIEDTATTADEIENEFGSNIRFLCEGVEKISKIRLKGKERELESLRKLFMAMAKDIRVVFIKLADRIHNLKTLRHVKQEKQARIARESLQIYVPVADRLGINEFKVQIEDLCFKALYKEEHDRLTTQIKQSKKERIKYIQEAKKEIQKLLTKSKIEFEKVEGRDKNLYSVRQKLRKKNLQHASEIHDLLALRIIVSDDTDCYRALGLIHAHWKPIPGRFKDYIAVPKPNGYQSLHTTVLGLAQSKVPTEIQIRTMQMHLDAELGPAAHWAYKARGDSHFDEKYRETTGWVPQDMEELAQIESSNHFFQHVTESLSKTRIHVLTPKGDVKNLPTGATPIDFAYAIHTQIGHGCVGAKVNGVIKPLSEELKAGDVVEIMSKTGRAPNPQWLKFVKSSSARHKIQNYLNQVHKQQTENSLTEKPEAKKYARPHRRPKFMPPEVKTPEDLKKYQMVIGGEFGLPHRFAKCCNPQPGKEVCAYNTRGKDFVIHEKNCKVFKNLDPERTLEAEFIMQKHFSILAKDRLGLMRDYSEVLTPKHIFIWKVDFKKLKDNVLLAKFTVNIPDEKAYKKAIQEIRSLEGVVEIQEKGVYTKLKENSS